MKLTIYGSGCSKCKLLTEHAEAAAKELGINYEIDKVSDMNAIIEAGVMRTPALAVNGNLVIEGAVPSADKLKTYLA